MTKLTLVKKSEPTPPVAKSIIKFEAWVSHLTITKAEDRTEAIETLKKVKESRLAVVEFFKDMKAKAHEAWKSIVAKETTYTKVLDEIEKTVKGRVLSYDQGQERMRLAEEQRLQEIADKEAEKERQKLLKVAAKLSGNAKKEKLEEAQAVEAMTVSVAPTLEYEQGESTRVMWKARVTNPAFIPQKYLIPNEKLLNQIAKETKGEITIPGVEFYPEQSLAIGGRV